MKSRPAAAIAFTANGIIGAFALSVALSGCFVRQLSPTTHVLTTEPNGSVVDDECVPDMQIIIRSALECEENGAHVVQECDGFSGHCTYTRDGKVFRECRRVSPASYKTYESDCMENGVHIDRKCVRGWSTITCTETVKP
jgi:hypothetical protein